MQEAGPAELGIPWHAGARVAQGGANGSKEDLKDGASDVRIVVQEGSQGAPREAWSGRLNTHWRTGRWGRTLSVMWAATSAMRRVLHDGHRPRPLHERGPLGPAHSPCGSRSGSAWWSGSRIPKSLERTPSCLAHLNFPCRLG